MPLPSRRLDEYLAALSAASPTPGGGSAAALSGAVAASLGLMVCAIAQKRAGTPELAALQERILPLRERFLALAEEDEQAFSRVIAAYRLPKEDPARSERVQDALGEACAVPLRSASVARDLLSLLLHLAPLGTKSTTSDVGVAALLARAALESALLNVDINLALLADPPARALLKTERDALQSEGADLAERTLALVRGRL